MADYSFGGSDEENAELKKLNAEVVCHLSPIPYPISSRIADYLMVFLARRPR